MLCVKAQHTYAAAQALSRHLAPDGYVVSVQNGLNEKIFVKIAGPERTVGAFVNFGADYIKPGVVQYGGRGAVVVEEIDGSISVRAKQLHKLFSEFDSDAVLTDNIWGYLWSKLAYGALLFATALTNESIADCLALAQYRRLFISLATEVLTVADAVGVCLESFGGFESSAFVPESSTAQAAHSLDRIVVHNRRSEKSHSAESGAISRYVIVARKWTRRWVLSCVPLMSRAGGRGRSQTVLSPWFMRSKRESGVRSSMLFQTWRNWQARKIPKERW